MIDRGACTASYTPSLSEQSYIIPKGYHNGSGKVTIKAAPTSLINGDASVSHVLSGKKFFSDSYTVKTGTMANYSSNVQTVTPSASQTGTSEFDIADGYHTKIKVNASKVYNAGVSAGGSGKYVVKTGTGTFTGTNGFHDISISTGLSSVTGFSLWGYNTANSSHICAYNSHTASGGEVTVKVKDNCGNVGFVYAWVAWGS